MSLCPSDEELTRFIEGVLPDEERRRLRAHIAGCPTCRTLVVDALRVAHEAEPDSQTGIRLPERRRAGRYELSEILGMGAMGVVYAAADPQLGRRVAIKILRAPLTEGRTSTSLEQRRQRFIVESRSLARVVHPNVVAIYDVGQLDDQVFIAMELVAGGTLRTWMQEEHSTDEILQLFEQIGRGLGAVHKAGLVHRDLKPENVLLGSDGRPRVTDFGLARGDWTDAAPPGPRPLVGTSFAPTSLTETGALLGTPAYMAPEQLRGQPVDGRADIFSFAVVMWEALFGVRPFAGASLDELATSIAAQRLVRPTTRLRTIERVVPILERALRVDPAERFQSIDELLAQLHRVRVPAPRLGPRLIAVAAGATLVAGAITLGLWRRGEVERCQGSQESSPWRTSLRPRLVAWSERAGTPAAQSLGAHFVQILDQYATRLDETRREICEATYVKRLQSEQAFDAQMECLQRRRNRLELTTESLISEAAGSGVRATEVASQLADPSECRTLQGSGRRTSSATRAAITRTLDAALTQLDFLKVSAATEAFARAAAQARALDEPALVAEALFGLTQARMSSGELALAIRHVEEGIATSLLAREALLAQKGFVLRVTIGRFAAESTAELERHATLFRWLEQRSGIGAAYEPRLLADLANSYAREGRALEAEALIRRGLWLATVRIGFRAELEHGLGGLLLDRGQLDEASLILHRAQLDTIAAYGADSLAALSIESSLVFLYYSLGGPAVAIAPQRRLVEHIERHGHEQSELLVEALHNLSAYLTGANHDRESLEVAERAVALADARLPPGSRTRGAALSGLAGAYLDFDRIDEALRILDLLQPVVDPKNEATTLEALSLHSAYVRAYVRRDPERARRELQRFLQIAALYEGRADVQAIRRDLDKLGKQLARR